MDAWPALVGVVHSDAQLKMHCGCGYDSDGALAQALLVGKADAVAHNQCALWRACKHNWTTSLRVVLADGRVSPGYISLEVAARRGHVETVALLLRDGRADPNAALFQACANSDLAMVRLALAHPRACANGRGTVAAKQACAKGDTAMVRLLLTDSRVSKPTGRDVAFVVAVFVGVARLIYARRSAWHACAS